MKYFYFVANIIFLFGVFGCAPPSVFRSFKNRVQIMEVQSPNCIINGGILQYENDTIRIGYIFWSNGGTIGLYIYNKINRPIYIDWKKTSFITGSTKHDYWDESVTIKEDGTVAHSSDGSLMSIPIAGTISLGFSQFLNKSSFSSITKVTKSERITFISPETTIEKNLFRIVDNFVTLNECISNDTLLMLKQKHCLTEKYYYDEVTKVGTLTQKYTEETSPLKFRSFITYSLDEKFMSEAYVNIHFYISGIIQIPFWAFDAKRITDPKEGTTQNIWITTYSFYVAY
jgi:hypothetical protein